MYLILVSALAALVAGFGVSYAGGGWALGIVAALVALIVCQLLIGRRLRRRIEPQMAKVKRQVEAQMLRPAIDTLRDLLPLGRWVPLLRGQLYAQMGVLAHHAGDAKHALEYLTKSSRRAGEAQLLLAALHERKGDIEAMKQVLDRAAPVQKKSAFFHNVHAWLLHKHGDTAGALARLNKFVQKDGGEASKDNLLRLQNGRKMNMKPFGMTWFALGYERPPAAMGQMQPPRKGFRQPKKSKRKSR